MTAVRRIRQGMRALLASRLEVDEMLAGEYLSLRQFELFRRLSRSEQLHSLNVLRYMLQRMGHVPQDLAAAALLHDIGKTRYQLAVWQRVFSVLLHRFFPALYYRWSEEEELSLLKAGCVVGRFHPVWGAALLRDTGASERLIWLVAHHQDAAAIWKDHPYGELLRRLQEADEAN